MIDTLQLEEQTVQAQGVPKLLVEWSSPWREFVGAIRPALARSEARLAGEAPFGLIPFRIMIPSYLLEAFLIFAAIAIQVKIAELRPYVAPRISGHDVIYYSGDELPRTEDLGGAEAGPTGRAGGEEAHHRTQTIKIARGGSLVPKVVDAPNLKLPSSHNAVANLLAIRPDAGPPPSEGMRSGRVAPNLHALIAPPANVIRDYTRNGVTLPEVTAPAANVARDRVPTAPNLSAEIVPPAPTVPNEHALVAPKLDPFVAPPATTNFSRDRTRAAPELTPTVAAPAPTVAHDQSRTAPALPANVVAPAPTVSREFASAPVQITNLAVAPPPVSAPEHAGSRESRLTLPAPAVVAPPPSTDISQDVRRLARGSIPDPSRTVVAPPPPTPSASGSLMSNIIGKIFGPSEVAPPPAAVNSTSTRGAAPSLTPNIAAPPTTAATSDAGGTPSGSRRGTRASLAPNVGAPPSAGDAAGTGARSVADSAGPRLGPPVLVPPPPSLSGSGGGTGTSGGGAGAPGGTLLANNLVPPPPSLGGGSASTGSGQGRKGAGLGAPMDIGSNLASPSTGGSGNGAGAVISTQPGTKVGVPTTGGHGELAMSPTGGDKPGIGGSGGGTSIGRGDGPGSGLNGTGTGAGKTGSGRGSDPNAHGGISPNPGPGGAGNATSGNPAVPGVSVSGGSSGIVTLPSFGSDPSPSDPPTAGRKLKQRQSFDVDIVATAGSGGALEPYKNLLHGEKHTIYPVPTDSSIVMEYAEQSNTGAGALKQPQPIRTNLPDGLPHARMVVICTLDASGNLKNVRVQEPGPAGMAAKVVAALHSWKFQPALRGDQPVEVTAILGFGIDTNDRF